MKGENIHFANSRSYQKKKAEKALAKAKELEASKQKGKTLHRVDSKTIVLR